MPIMDGWQFLDEFRKTRTTNSTATGQTIIYLVSSSNSITDLNKAKDYQDQIKDYFFKPMTLDDLKKIF
jgi:CheY-like chemotaxis protein